MHETSTTELLRWIVFLPLLGAAINGLLNKRLPERLVSSIAVGSIAASFVLSLKVFLDLRALPADARILSDFVWSWIPIGELSVDLEFMADPLTACMLLLVTGVGLLIHIYSVGYMHGDAGFSRYFAYLNLCAFSMLVLVAADSLPLLFVGWEGVGLCSYLLIGFWYQDMANSIAGKKAFIVNRIGDFGFLLGMFVIFKALSGHVAPGESIFAFSTMAAHADLLAPVAVLAGLLLFVGATGKSAQIPLYVWLPDAMAGPTPVSALIHAATMVTAGVYMMARMNFLYDLAPTALAVVAVIGAATALLAATIGLAQTDIKKVLAYSTVSQLGYMFMACGVGAYGVGIFHVLTHAFFKALLFMGAGSVIHALHHEQDMRNMGGLKDKLPWTFRTMMVATLAIAGVFPFAGFFSKDEILYKSFLWSPLLWIVGFAVAGLTAFYMARLMAMTFFGECRVSKDKLSHVHESPWMMVGPLVVLAVLSFAGGWMGWPAFMGGNNAIEHWLEPVFHHEVALDAHPGEVDAHISGTYASADAAAQEEHGAAADDHGAADSHGAEGAHGDDHGEHNVALEWGLAIGSFAWALLGLGLGFLVYTRRPGVAASGRAALGGLAHRLVENKYYVDEIYDALVVWPINRFSETALWRFVDVAVIDGLLVNGISRSLGLVGQLLRLVQNGMLRWYAWSFAAGVLVVLFYLSRHVNG
jgi:NADH-quinone oxidoreductase subunit L